MVEDGPVLVIGAAAIDVKGTSHQRLLPKNYNLGLIHTTFGGVARNIAENLARLDVNVILLTALGDDIAGDSVHFHCTRSGINTDYIRRCPEARTSQFMAVFDKDHALEAAVSDFEIMPFVDVPYLDANRDLFAEAQMIVIDLNLTDDALHYVVELADQYNLPIVADPTSPVRAGRLQPFLDRMYLVTPNAAETTALCGLDVPAHDLDTAIQAAHNLISIGTEIAIVTLGERGLAYSDGTNHGHIPAVKTKIVDETGAGDALTAAVIFGLLNDLPLDEAMRLGVTAASLTLRCKESVSPDLTPDLLYSSLVV